MKYMKLGSKPNIFHTSNDTTCVCSELPSDMAFRVERSVFCLHKFPVLSKCGMLQKLVADCSDEVVKLDDIPGGVKAFELCIKFCYGITITLNAYNVMSVRCAAEYLGMTEAVERGNLIFKLEVFLSSSIFKGWKDSIIALESTRPLLPWSQDVQMISRCIDSIASKTSVDPSKVDWSFTYTRKCPKNGIVTHAVGGDNGQNISHCRHSFVPKDWWIEDICELDIEFYSRVILAIKSKGIMSHKRIGEALQVYAYRCLLGVSKEQTIPSDNGYSRAGQSSSHHELIESQTAKHKMLLETVVGLLPDEKGSCTCSFMLRLLKAATILGADTSTKMDLASRIGPQLEEASLNDLLIPSLSYSSDALYDVDIVQRILEHFLVHNQSPSSCSPVSSSNKGHMRDYEKRRPQSTDHLGFVVSPELMAATHAAKLNVVSKLIDAYLAEIARDTTLPLAQFVELLETIPEFARPVHDGLYRAVDIYLKEHPMLTKSEKKKLCRLMDCKKLSMDACMHAAQNERLPLRVVVQVLFFEQVRTATTGSLLLNELPSNLKASLEQAIESSSEDHTESTIMQSNVHAHEEEEYVPVGKGFDTLNGTNVEDMGRSAITQWKVFMTKQSKAKRLLSSSKKMLNRLLPLTHGASMDSKDSDISKNSGSSVISSATSNKMELKNSTKIATTTTTRTGGAALKDIRRQRHSTS